MYLTLEQLTLVGDKRRARPDDPPIYEREYRGQRIFTTDASPSRSVGPAIRYGVLYFDSRDEPCIVPDAWSDEDAQVSKLALWPESLT